MSKAFGPPFYRLGLFDSDGSDGAIEFFEPHEILYIFRGSILHKHPQRIQAPWVLPKHFHPFVLYARTLSGVRRVDMRTITGVHAALPDFFVLCDPAMIVNRRAIRWFQVSGAHLKWVGFRVPVGEFSLVEREWVRINRSRVRDVLGPFD
jgi:hypothetical protein